MGTPGLGIVRFRKRYYIRYSQLDSYFEGLGAKIIASIPSDPQEYLRNMPLKVMSTRSRDGVDPDYSQFREFETLPSEFRGWITMLNKYFYIINLDQEVLTMNHSIHWKLGNIPRQDELWLRASVKSIYRYKPTISPDVCPEEHMSSPALEFPKPNQTIEYDFQVVTPRTHLAEAPKAFLTFIMASTLIRYKDEIIRFGMEWRPDSFQG